MGSCFSRNAEVNNGQRSATSETTQMRNATTVASSSTARRSSAPVQGTNASIEIV